MGGEKLNANRRMTGMFFVEAKSADNIMLPADFTVKKAGFSKSSLRIGFDATAEYFVGPDLVDQDNRDEDGCDYGHHFQRVG